MEKTPPTNPAVCKYCRSLAVSRVKVISTPTATAGLFRASSVRFGLSTLGTALWVVLWRKRGVPCYAWTRVDGLDVTHSVCIARARIPKEIAHCRTPYDPPRHAPLSPCSALHTSTARHSPSRSTPPLRYLHYRVHPPLRTASATLLLVTTPLNASDF